MSSIAKVADGEDAEEHSEDRSFRMVELRRSGLTYEEIGEVFDLTRERVRQILMKDSRAPTVKELRRQRKQDAIELEDENRRRVRHDLLLNPGSSRAEISKRLGLDVVSVRKAVPQELRKLIVERKNVVQAFWTDEEAFQSLQDAQTYLFPLTTNGYCMLLRLGEVRGPSVPRLMQRFGSWRSACEQAGVEAGLPRRSGYESRWTDQDLLLFVCRYLEADDSTGAIADYERWTHAEADAPSAQTVRNRLGDWSEVKAVVLGGIWKKRNPAPISGNSCETLRVIGSP
jgi:hypothetical protein